VVLRRRSSASPLQYQIWYDGNGWTVETLNQIVDEELAALPADMRARFVRIAELIEAVGLPNVREPHVRHLRGPIWEIRLKGATGIARALYVTALGQRVIVVRVFVKKTQKTPRSEIAIAVQRAKDLMK
jgi:phage-related protein